MNSIDLILIFKNDDASVKNKKLKKHILFCIFSFVAIILLTRPRKIYISVTQKIRFVK